MIKTMTMVVSVLAEKDGYQLKKITTSIRTLAPDGYEMEIEVGKGYWIEAPDGTILPLPNITNDGEATDHFHKNFPPSWKPPKP